MIDYVYKAKSIDTGDIVSAQVKAESPEAAAKLLSQQNLYPIEVIPKSESDPVTAIATKLGLAGRVGTKDRVVFTRQLSTLINAGLPLARALRTVQGQITNKTLNDVINNVLASVEGGMPLSAAFAEHPNIFNNIYVSLVAAGEASGTLDKALLRLATQQEKDAAITSKIRSAMIYPAIVLILIVAVVTFMVIYVVPQVATLYQGLGKPLPFITQGLMDLANFIEHFWWLAILVIIALIAAARAALQTERAKYLLDELKLNVPIFGIIFRKLYMARFARTQSSLLASGIPMLQALETTKGAIGNRIVAAELALAINKIRGGIALSEALEDCHHFLLLVSQMARVGEESGAIDDMLARTATYFEDEVDEAVRNLSTTLEPIMMVVLGGIVALVLVAVLGPVYSLVGSGSITSTNSAGTSVGP